MLVYVALKDVRNRSSEILGIFSSKEAAEECCLKQPTFTRQAWEKGEFEGWENGHGLYVKVVEYEVA